MKHIALDLGTVWTGIAISDKSNLLARPLKTVSTKELVVELSRLFEREEIQTVIVGYPLTMSGTESAQTKITVGIKERLEKQFLQKKFVLWDERLSSSFADEGRKVRTKQEKLQSHARAAAIILDTYLVFLKNEQMKQQKSD
jgi:putative Holliday junction resolvase